MELQGGWSNQIWLRLYLKLVAVVGFLIQILNNTVYVITFGSQVIWQYKMDLFPVAVLGSRNYFVWQN